MTPQRTYIPGSRTSTRGPQRRTVPVSDADWAAVERLLAGDRSVQASTAALDVAIDLLDGLGLSASRIAVRLGVTVRTVMRRRAARAVAPLVPTDGAS